MTGSLQRGRWRWRLLTLGYALLLVSAYWWGRSHSDAAEMARVHIQLAAQRERAMQLEQQLINRMLAAEVDWRSMEGLRQTLAGLDQRIAAQEEELNLYRLLLQQDSSVKGLHIEYWRVTAADEPGFYDYRLVVRQNLDLREAMQVSLKVALLGEVDGEQATYTLAELDEGVDRDVVPLSFRYFKFFDGRLALPEKFAPREVEISVWPRGKREDARVRRFTWENDDGEESETRVQ